MQQNLQQIYIHIYDVNNIKEELIQLATKGTDVKTFCMFCLKK